MTIALLSDNHLDDEGVRRTFIWAHNWFKKHDCYLIDLSSSHFSNQYSEMTIARLSENHLDDERVGCTFIFLSKLLFIIFFINLFTWMMKGSGAHSFLYQDYFLSFFSSIYLPG